MSSYDAVHVFVAGYSSFLLTLFPVLAASALCERPFILHYHDGRAGDHLERSQLANGITRQAKRIVVPSAYLVDVFEQLGFSAIAIANIVDSTTFRFRERATVSPRFLHNRGLESHYNVECSLRAFAIVQNRYPQASLNIAHDGPLRASLESLAADLRLNHVRFLGAVTSEEMRKLYDDADIYLMSPNADNMPLSILECFAAGLPILSTSVGGVPYMVESEKTGILVPLDDYRALAAAALRLIEETGLGHTLAANARRECQKYQPAAIAKQWLEVYREVSCQTAE
jgi:glycosyltransferase involved in cell wall biosynthesis